jgi:hypothetical protein
VFFIVIDALLIRFNRLIVFEVLLEVEVVFNRFIALKATFEVEVVFIGSSHSKLCLKLRSCSLYLPVL